MILKNNLYQIISRPAANEPQPVYGVRLLPECFIYKAHFPGQPITPGVCTVQMAMEILAEYLGVKLRLTGVKNVKFLSILSPQETPEVEFHILKYQKLDDHTLKAQVSVETMGQQKAKVSFYCEKVD
ncbi:MAG: hydroxymyristoyl-ACP dehydratase [Prevotella sp.]|jgi:3-hydroxyacyl-[acyl-carrier-protein] dehydratase